MAGVDPGLYSGGAPFQRGDALPSKNDILSVYLKVIRKQGLLRGCAPPVIPPPPPDCNI